MITLKEGSPNIEQGWQQPHWPLSTSIKKCALSMRMGVILPAGFVAYCDIRQWFIGDLVWWLAVSPQERDMLWCKNSKTSK